MAREKQVFTESFKIRSSEVQTDNRATIQSICNLLQETAASHALQLNVDISNLREQNLTWVLHRLRVRMSRYPSWRDKVIIKTWPSSGDTLRAYRDFQIMDSSGDEIGTALSYWLMLNIETRRPVRMPDEILNLAPEDVNHVFEVNTKRLREDNYSTSESYRVRRSDLDLNDHVNNVQYIDWSMDTLPGYRPVSELDIEFHGECGYGDQIVSSLEIVGENFTRHKIVRKADEKLLALGEFKY